MPDSNLTSQYGLLLCGVCFFLLAVAGTLTGETVARIGRVIYRAKEPKQFWGAVAVQYLGGLFLTGYFLYKLYGPSH